MDTLRKLGMGLEERLVSAFVLALGVHMVVAWVISSIQLFRSPDKNAEPVLKIILIEPPTTNAEQHSAAYESERLPEREDRREEFSENNKPRSIDRELQMPVLSTIKPPELKSVKVSMAALAEFIKNETKAHKQSNPIEVSEFDKSFEVAIEEKQADDNLRDLSVLGSGLYNARVNGRVLCTIRMVNPFKDDWSGDVAIANDCTPPQKLRLKIR